MGGDEAPRAPITFDRHPDSYRHCRLGAQTWAARRDNRLPSAKDDAHVESRMRPVCEPGKVAGWVAPPLEVINERPLDFDYVRFN